MTSRRIDAAVAVALFLGGSVWGAWHYSRFVGRGGRPFFYQSYFEPAVMTACGRGFVVAATQPPALHAFLYQQTDRFSCDDLPRDLTVGTRGLYQRPWRYLMTSVALAWMALGISWSGLGPLFGALFGATTAAVYGVGRQCAGRIASAIAAIAMCLSPLQTANLPNLRDYAKAPFTIGLALLLTALVLRRRTLREVMALSLAYGALLGIGYGFRTDLLIHIPAFLVGVACFLPGDWWQHRGMKLAAVGCCALGFLVAAWPILTAISSGGGCQWHFVLLGLARPFDAALGVAGGDYAWGHLYKDEAVWAAVSTFAHHAHPDWGHVEYCSRDYDAASWAYLRQIVATFPADFVTRAYASAWHMLNFAFHQRAVPAVVGPVVTASVLVTACARSARVALFAAFAIMYFGGQLAIQYLPRHYFPFEFISLVVLAIVVERATCVWWRSDRGGRADWRRAGVCVAAVAIALAAPLMALRVYQNRQVTQLLATYAAAPTTALGAQTAAPGVFRTANARAPESISEAVAALGSAEPRLVAIDIDTGTCRPGTTMTFQYDHSYAVTDLTFSMPIDSPAAESGTTRIIEPVYPGFQGVDLSDASASCTPRLSTVRTDGLPLLLSAQLTPGWMTHSQFQRMSLTR